MSRYRDKLDDNDIAYARARAPSQIVKGRPAPFGGNAGINPHVSRFKLRDGRLMDVFHVKPIYYETPCGSWRPLSEVCLFHGNHRIVIDAAKLDQISWRYLAWLVKRQRLLGIPLDIRFSYGLYSGVRRFEFARADTLTVYPDPSVEVTTVDGRVAYATSGGGTWAEAHDALTGTIANDSSATFIGNSQSSGSNFIVSRPFTLFDASALGAAATITAATVSVSVSALVNDDNDGDDWLNVVQSSPASNTALVTADFDQCGSVSNPTEGSTRIDLGSLTNPGYNDFALDATGLTWVSKTSITKLGWREGHDALNSSIAAAANSSVTINSADTALTTSDPKLLVTYSVAPLGVFAL